MPPQFERRFRLMRSTEGVWLISLPAPRFVHPDRTCYLLTLPFTPLRRPFAGVASIHRTDLIDPQ
jgi:hypothetical protein